MELFLIIRENSTKPITKKVRQQMNKQDVSFAACTGKQCERVEELFGDEIKNIWILGDSATRIKREG